MYANILYVFPASRKAESEFEENSLEKSPLVFSRRISIKLLQFVISRPYVNHCWRPKNSSSGAVSFIQTYAKGV